MTVLSAFYLQTMTVPSDASEEQHDPQSVTQDASGCQPGFQGMSGSTQGSARSSAPTLYGLASCQISTFEPYCCVKTKADEVFGLVVPKELLLEEQRVPGWVTLRLDPSSERTFPISDVLPHDTPWIDLASKGQEGLRSSMPYLRKILRRDAENADPILHAKRLQGKHGAFSGAAFLHDQIPANRWGISMVSLDHFVAVVTEKWLRRDITNTSGYSSVKFDDELIGPNMYQVCEQVITPMTADPSLMLPGVSWALKESLAGSEVFHFVSHAWAKGVFEFHRLLKQAWSTRPFPHKDKAAYICFLSNPQNLDIQSMLAHINTSPFHVALQQMPEDGKLILIATGNTPIHTRLWCVFEAFIAMERRITIMLAGDRSNLALDAQLVRRQERTIHRHASAAQGFLRLIDSINCFLDFDCRRCERVHGTNASTAGKWSNWMFIWIWSFVVLALLVLLDSTVDSTFCNDFGMLVCVFIPFWLLTCCAFSCSSLCYFCCRARYLRSRKYFEGIALKGSFLNVRDSRCSSPEDAERIRAVLAGKEDEVSAMIGSIIINLQAWWPNS